MRLKSQTVKLRFLRHMAGMAMNVLADTGEGIESSDGKDG
jgi:hypothetical protein